MEQDEQPRQELVKCVLVVPCLTSEGIFAEKSLLVRNRHHRLCFSCSRRVLNDLEGVARLDQRYLEETRSEIEANDIGVCCRHAAQR